MPSVSHQRFIDSFPNSRIVGGQESVIGQFPWQVSMQQNNRHYCGGSLITTTHVMCAAHCLVTSGTITANLGAVDYRNPEQKITQQKFTAHPQYNSATIDFDYAVIKLSSAAILGENVNTIKLAAQNKEYSGTATLSGWGYTTRFLQSTPIMLQHSTLPLVSQADCQSVWGSVIAITDRIQCAGGDGKVSSCSGDSGGPLTVQDNGETILIGSASWAESTCNPQYPGGYCKISDQRSWIDAQLN
uniref:Peptidase S1 domain-containing protein n=1 Tax=Ciona savignyi TaxID=51511 RepID=H2ZD77_CIOSA